MQNHPLPFSSQALITAINFFMYLLLALPHQIRALDLYELRRWLQPSCRVLETVSMVPVMVGEGFTSSACCSPNVDRLVIAHVFMVLGSLVPLGLVYWQERSSKAAFLHSRGIRGGPEPGLPWVLIVVCTWCGCAASWAALSAWYTLGQ